MKTRGIVVIDYDKLENFRAVAEEEEKLLKSIEDIVKGNPHVVFHQIKMTERRGDTPPDIHKMKFRST
tara:strand:+ start:1181 stop:1384 length:204 start_codon:yes stop_codon:yes gene_type:complete